MSLFRVTAPFTHGCNCNAELGGTRGIYVLLYRSDGEKQTFGLTIVSRWIGELGDDGNTASLFATFSIFFITFCR